MVLGSTQPLTEKSTRNLPLEGGGGGKSGRCVGLKTLPPSCATCLEILVATTFWSPKSVLSSVQGQLYLYLYDEED
jgi:hypothetical protein